MTSKIRAIQAYCPRIELGTPANAEFYMELVTQSTTLSSGVVKNVQEAEATKLISLLLNGQSVHTGVAIYTPSVDLNGDFEVKVRVDKRILQALNAPGAFRGTLINAENIGKTSDELVALWNADHPEDPVV